MPPFAPIVGRMNEINHTESLRLTTTAEECRNYALFRGFVHKEMVVGSVNLCVLFPDGIMYNYNRIGMRYSKLTCGTQGHTCFAVTIFDPPARY
jgi:hypothetical protein